MNASEFVSALRAAAPYVHAHRGRVFVLAVTGEVVERADFNKLICDVALLHSMGVKIVLVHGARPQIDRAIVEAGLTPRYVGQLRVTDQPSLECAKAVVGRLRMEIEAQLSTSLASTPMGGARLKIASGNWVTAKPVGVRAGIDHLHTGEIRRIDVETIRQVLEHGRIALMSPMGYSPTGEIFNLRSEDVATQVAVALGADKLIFSVPSNPDGWPLANDAGDVGQFSLREAESLSAAASQLDADDRAYLDAALSAGRAGVRRIHLIGADTEGALLRELYTRDGVGLMIYSDADYEATRQAAIEDIGGILALIQPLEQAGVLVARSREQLELEIERFSVIVRDGMVIACAALIAFEADQLGEFACVAVHADYQRGGRAALLLSRVEAQARKLGLRRLFSLTTHTPHWFIEHGFSRSDIEALPPQRQQLYNLQRNSLVLVKDL